jgi:hypothetical protein
MKLLLLSLSDILLTSRKGDGTIRSRRIQISKGQEQFFTREQFFTNGGKETWRYAEQDQLP